MAPFEGGFMRINVHATGFDLTNHTRHFVQSSRFASVVEGRDIDHRALPGTSIRETSFRSEPCATAVFRARHLVTSGAKYSILRAVAVAPKALRSALSPRPCDHRPQNMIHRLDRVLSPLRRVAAVGCECEMPTGNAHIPAGPCPTTWQVRVDLCALEQARRPGVIRVG